jgi:hypothetical protein
MRDQTNRQASGSAAGSPLLGGVRRDGQAGGFHGTFDIAALPLHERVRPNPGFSHDTPRRRSNPVCDASSTGSFGIGAGRRLLGVRQPHSHTEVQS